MRLAQRLDGALEDVLHVEVAADLTDVGWLALVDLGGIPSDDDKVLGVGQISDDVLCDPISEPLPFRIIPNIFKWQYGNGRLVWQRGTGVPDTYYSPDACADDQQHCGSQFSKLLPTVGADGLRDVLDRLLAWNCT